jgi:hypothetical protein
MVIRTEYRGQRYSRGSSDPVPAGFEIRFGSLNFQATGNGYLMRITNRDELRAWRLTGPGPVPVTLAAASTTTTLRSALSTGVNGMTTGRARRLAMRRDHWRDGNRASGGARGFRAAVPPWLARRHNSVCRILQH